uniref:O-fucosyltransferase family protein n=1 Tax=Physcomitrium patens TaxID=3218 RepID=A0A2K1K7D3_PHYPA|nr:hypothetical protein PHYPA_011578 [Physcomitrium patens]
MQQLSYPRFKASQLSKVASAVLGGCLEVASSKVKSFGYLYDEQHFITAVKDDVRVVKLLPNSFRTRASLQKLPVKTPTRFSSVQFYLDEVLPALSAHGACGLVFAKGGGLQEILPTELVEYQRLRCRVAFHALRFREEIRGLGAQLVRRLEAHGRPYVVVHFGLERDVLAYHGCAELFQDLQTESIQYQRKKMLISAEIDGELRIDSHKQRHRGLCPLMPSEVGLLLEAFGFRNDTQLYMAGTEITGGQRVVLPLRSMYPSLDDRFTLTTDQERFALYAVDQQRTPDTSEPGSVYSNAWKKLFVWGKNRPSGYSYPSQKGWWRSVGECEYGTEKYFASTPVEGETNDIQLLHAALDYIVSLDANTYFPAFDKDRQGLPNMASLIMGHRLYQSASLKTFRPNRSVLSALLDQYPHDHSQEWNSWTRAMREVLVDALRPEAIVHLAHTAKSELFLAHPFPECFCRIGQLIRANDFRDLSEDGELFWGRVRMCPARTPSEH